LIPGKEREREREARAIEFNKFNLLAKVGNCWQREIHDMIKATAWNLDMYDSSGLTTTSFRLLIIDVCDSV
jgi:hypothetical protein